MSIAAVAWLQDPELLSALEGIKKKDAELDGKIDEIGKVVGRLGVLATEMNKELKVQEMMAQDLPCLPPPLRPLEHTSSTTHSVICTDGASDTHQVRPPYRKGFK
jgi:hypothetical protein